MTVSMRLSPFTVEVEEPPKFSVSADRRFSASSKELRVRVEGSLNILTMVLPLRVGTFLMVRSLTSENALAVCRMVMSSESEYSEISMRCLWLLNTAYSPPSGAEPTRAPCSTFVISTVVRPSTSSR